MRNCPHCGYEFQTRDTHVDASCLPPKQTKDGPNPVCMQVVYRDHDLTKRRICGKPAVLVDAFFPVYWDGNLCSEHLNPQKPVEFSI